MQANGKTTRILVVDDEETLRESLRTYLQLEGYAVDTAAGAEEAMSLDLSTYNLILLDIMLGGMSGLEMARRLKADATDKDIPIIFLSALGNDDDMVRGLRLGGDDYIAKPYSIKNVIARIEAVLRRAPKAVRHGVECDRHSLSCHVDGKPMKLPRKEFEILALLLENRGRIFSREELLSRIWPEETVVVDRCVDVHITRLRGKIKPYGKHIISRSGYGYGWQD